MIAILGGTFDPVHLGHIHFALMVSSTLPVDTVYFVPCKTPLLKADAKVSPAQRVEMLKLAIAPFPEFKIDTRELDRDTPSYMIDTLRSFKKEFPNETLILLLGMDAFADLPRWHCWKELLNFCHILVVARPHSTNALSDELTTLLAQKQTEDISVLSRASNGNLFFLPIEEKDIASTIIRHDIHEGHIPKSHLPASVLKYIQDHALYTRDHSKH